MSKSNTIFGWVLASGIVALGLTSIASKVFHADHPALPEGKDPGFAIVGAVEGEGESGPDLATLLASGSAADGEKTFAKCQACHTINAGGANGIGPNLHGIVGAAIGKHAAGFSYSSALAEHGGEWSYENLDQWLSSPRAFAAGNKMSFPGLSDPQDRANVLLFLRENGGGPALPTPEVAATESDEAAAGEPAGAEAEAAPVEEAPAA